MDNSKENLILDASFGLFSKYWYRNVSVDKITKEAWIAKGTFYLYYENKDALYKAIIDNIMQFHLCQVDVFAKNITDVKERVYKDLYHSFMSLEKSALIRNIVQGNKDYYSESVNPEYFEEKAKMFSDRILDGLPSEMDKEKLWNYLIMIIWTNSYLIWMKWMFDSDEEYHEFLKDYIAMVVTGLFSNFEKNKFPVDKENRHKKCLLESKKVCFAKIKDFINKFKNNEC